MASSHRLTDSFDIEKSVTRIITALKKVYASKNITFETDIEDNCKFKGDQRDLMEVIGNVLDNGCKASNKLILIEAKQLDDQLIISIHDDGDGIAKELRPQLLKRGQRADSRHPGQGIGLDVVRDIIENYQGEFAIDQSPLGGALFKLTFTQPKS
jgi:two-component system sensor histidine kinase PhoQ